MKLNRKVLATVLIGLALVLGVTGCGSSQSSPQPGQDSKSPSGKQLVVGFSVNTLENPYFVDMVEGAKAFFDEKGVKLVVLDAQNNPGKQLKDCESLIQQKVDLLMVDPADTVGIVPAIKEANDAKIPVVWVDRQPGEGCEWVAGVGVSQQGGRLTAEYIAKRLNGKGKVAQVDGILGTDTARNRANWFTTVMKEYPNIKIVAHVSANYDRAQGMKVTEDILQANPDIDAIWYANDEMALGGIAAIKAAGKTGKIIVTGIDNCADGARAVKNGEMDATSAEPPYFQGKLGAETAYKYLMGESIQKVKRLPVILCTKDNVDKIKMKGAEWVVPEGSTTSTGD